jgi:hypothetical protein
MSRRTCSTLERVSPEASLCRWAGGCKLVDPCKWLRVLGLLSRRTCSTLERVAPEASLCRLCHGKLPILPTCCRMTSGYWENGRGNTQCTLTDVALRVALLMLASWLYRGVLALLSLRHCEPRVVTTGVVATGVSATGVSATGVSATSGLVAQHSQHSTCNGSYPPLTSLPRRASPRARFLGAAALVIIRHILFEASDVGVDWGMGNGEYAVCPPPPAKFILALLHCFFDATSLPLCIPTVLTGSQR